MLLFPNCKINLGLNVVSKRDDGYHNLQTVFYPVKIYDALEIVSNQSTASGSGASIKLYGNEVEGATENNLCIKAYNLLKDQFSQIPPVTIHLYKNIPSGAGLGGGSADGAFTLKLLNDKYSLKLSTHQLTNLALKLGSDCPYFIINTPCFAKGRGELLTPIQLDLSGYWLVLVNPCIHVSTAAAFTGIKPKEPTIPLSDAINQPLKSWKTWLVNDFETTVFEKHPEIGQIKQALYEKGAVYASMTGSGSTVYGIFKQPLQLRQLFPSEYLVKTVPC